MVLRQASIIEPPVGASSTLKDHTADVCFTFEAHDELVISTYPLHFDKHWPFATSVDATCIMLTQKRTSDELLALWKPPSLGFELEERWTQITK